MENYSHISTAEQHEYWAQQSTDDNGMLGGYPQVSSIDIKFSLNFMRRLRRTHPPSTGIADDSTSEGRYAFRSCLEPGAGIGRVTIGLLAQLCEKIEIIEPMEKFTAVLTAADSPLVKSGQLRRVYNVPLQEWTTASVPSYQVDEQTPVEDLATEDEASNASPKTKSRYDLIYNQWCLDYLSTPHLIRYFRSLIPLLTPDAWIIVKENISSAAAGADIWWDESSSVTRTDRNLRKCFDDAGLEVARTQLQTGFPKTLLPVRMYALRPAEQG